jgi:hypothetical protein
MTEVANEGDYARVLRLARIRQKHWYNRNVKKVSENRRKDRQLFKELKQQAGIITTSRNLPVEPAVENEYYEQETEPYYEQENIPEAPQPVEKVRFTNLTDKQIKKLKKRQTNSKQTYAGIIEILKKHTTSKKSIETYKTTIKQLYEMTETDINKPINLNNPQLIFQKLDTLQYKGKNYGIDKLTEFAQTLVLLSDIQKGFNLDVSVENYNIYNNKFKELKIMKRENQTNKVGQVIHIFTPILNKALEVFGIESKFYLYLKLYQLAPLRDNMQLKIISDEKEADSKKINYIVIPKPIKMKGRKNTVYKPHGKLIYNTYKTEKNQYIKDPYPMTFEATKLVREYIARNNIKEGEYLFGDKLMSQWVGIMLKRLGISIKGQNVNLLRHAVVTEFYTNFYKNNKKPTAKEILEFSEKMAHSPQMSALYIRSISGETL